MAKNIKVNNVTYNSVSSIEAPLAAGGGKATFVESSEINTPSPYASTPAMDGIADAGSSDDYSRGDHVHPSDTSKQAAITASGILKGNGSAVSAATAGTDYVAPSALSDYLAKSGGTMSGDLTANNPAVADAKVRNISAGTTDLTAGSSSLATGALYFVYE